MSQYPPYPQYPQYQYPQAMYGMPDPRADLLRPAKRASILMFILAGLLLLCGVCFGAFGVIPMEQLPPEQVATMAEFEKETGYSLRTVSLWMAGGGVVPGVLLLVLGIFVRRGGMVMALAALMLSILMGLVLLWGLVSSAITAAQDPAGIMGICVVLIPLALTGLLVVWLFQAVRNAPRLDDLRAGEQTAYWQSSQQRQEYRGGYWQPPPPPPPPGG